MWSYDSVPLVSLKTMESAAVRENKPSTYEMALSGSWSRWPKRHAALDIFMSSILASQPNFFPNLRQMADMVEGWGGTLVCPCTGVCVCVIGVGRTVTTGFGWPQNISEISTHGQRWLWSRGSFLSLLLRLQRKERGVNEERWYINNEYVYNIALGQSRDSMIPSLPWQKIFPETVNKNKEGEKKKHPEWS